jgi:hypothetical protein
VGATGQHQSLISALDELDTLADGADRDTLAGLRGRLEDGRLRVLVVGEAKRGKSTLVNALLGREVLPSAVVPLTAVATTVTYGMDEQAGRRDQELGIRESGLAAVAARLSAGGGGRCADVTQDYLIGEVSVRLQELEAATRRDTVADLARLRRQVETSPVTALAEELARALAAADLICWESLARGDTVAFARQAQVSAELRQFGVCARLIADA